MDPELLKLIGGGLTAGALLTLIYIVGMRMVSAIDKIGVKVDVHTKDDLAAHSAARDMFVRIDEQLKTVLDERERTGNTPIEGVPIRRTTPRGVPIGEYGFRRGKTHGDDR